MDADVALSLGLLGLALAVPAAFAALADGRRPVAAGLLAAGGAGFVLWSLAARGWRLSPADAAEAIYGTIGWLF